MKIFDWVHRRIHTNKEYCRVPQHKKEPYVGDGGIEDQGERKETEKEALLMNLYRVTSIQGVLDGILTIGTLGHHDYQGQQQLIDVNSNAHQVFQSVDFASKEEEAQVEEEVKEQEPVELTASAPHPNYNLAAESIKKVIMEEVDIKNGNTENIAAEEGDLLEPLLEAIKANGRKRITLADLFLASEDHLDDQANPTSLAAPVPAKIALEKEAKAAVEKAQSCRAKHSGSITKKLAPWKKGGEDSPPATKKLHRMMRKILKKKIHPEMARDMHASVPGTEACKRNKSIDESATRV